MPVTGIVRVDRRDSPWTSLHALPRRQDLVPKTGTKKRHMSSPTSNLSPRSPLLLFGVVGGPVAWILEILLVVYASQACAARELELIIGTVVISLLAVAACAVCWRIWREGDDGSGEGGGRSDRTVFMAVGGLDIGGISLFVILTVVVSALLLGNKCS